MLPKFGGFNKNKVSSQSILVTKHPPTTEPPPIPSPYVSLIVNTIVSPIGIQTCVCIICPV